MLRNIQSPFHHFKSSMIEFDQYRNSQYIQKIKGLKNTETNTNKKYIGIEPPIDIQIGDTLINTNIKYYIVDIDTASWLGKVDEIKAYYQTTPPKEQQASSTVYNIGTAQNTIIGNQKNATINNASSIDDLKQLIELYGQNDKQQLNELVTLLKDSLDKDEFHKSKLSKFGDLLAKHSWLPLAISQIIAGYLSH